MDYVLGWDGSTEVDVVLFESSYCLEDGFFNAASHKLPTDRGEVSWVLINKLLKSELVRFFDQDEDGPMSEHLEQSRDVDISKISAVKFPVNWKLLINFVDVVAGELFDCYE